MTWPWIHAAATKLGIALEPYPALARWYAVIGERPAVRRGLEVPDLAAHRRAA